jgi:hypothetical protein
MAPVSPRPSRLALAAGCAHDYILVMAAIDDVEKLALDLPESQRAVLAAHLLGSLSPFLQDLDEGMAEARRRDAELDANPALGVGLEDLDRRIKNRRS